MKKSRGIQTTGRRYRTFNAFMRGEKIPKKIQRMVRELAENDENAKRARRKAPSK